MIAIAYILVFHFCRRWLSWEVNFPKMISMTDFSIDVLPSQFGASFQRARKARKRSQIWVAEHAGLSRMTIVQLEKGENVGLHAVMKALGALDLGLRLDTARLNYDDIRRMDDDDG